MKIKVLIAEDSPDDAELLLAELRRSGFAPDWKRVDTEPDFLAGLQGRPDIILSDFAMPQFNGLRAVDLVRESGLDIPFLLISGTVGEEIAVEAMQRGVTDYLLKDRTARLGYAVTRALQGVAERAERRKLEAQFIEAQKMEVVGQLASGIAHDFNNVLMTIMGYNDLIAFDLDPDHPLREHVAEIRHASERAAGLTRQLLVFSRKEKVLPVVLDLNYTVRELEKMLRRLIGENIELTIAPAPDAGRIKADSGYIGQIVMNMVVNARDAMPAGGRIIISTGNATLNGSHSSVSPGKYVMVKISDTGTGMTEEVRTRLFEAFFTTKPKGQGTGLGLATCQTIAQQSGGCIDVESELGKGTTFTVYFPRVDEAAAPVARTAQTGPLPAGTETVMVVEDETCVRDLTSGVLASRGYSVLTAANGKEALRLMRDHTGTPVRLIITDVIMPQMDGKVMAEWLKVAFPDLKILFTSGYTAEALAPHGVLEPGVEFLSKPYSPGTLLHKVRELLDH